MFLCFFSDEAIATQKKLIFVLYNGGQHHNLREYDSENQGGRVDRGIAKKKAGTEGDFRERENQGAPDFFLHQNRWAPVAEELPFCGARGSNVPLFRYTDSALK